MLFPIATKMSEMLASRSGRSVDMFDEDELVELLRSHDAKGQPLSFSSRCSIVVTPNFADEIKSKIVANVEESRRVSESLKLELKERGQTLMTQSTAKIAALTSRNVRAREVNFDRDCFSSCRSMTTVG